MYERHDAYDVFGQRRQRDDSRWVCPSRTRTKQDWPYSYDEFFIFGSREDIRGKDIHSAYSDRLSQWDHAKFEAAVKPFKKRFEHYSRAEASEFLTTYYGQETKCVALAEGCNVSNGYPYHVFWFTQTPVALPLAAGSAT